MVGIALALTAIVIILIVNKKKKVEVPKEEVKPETVLTENDLNLIKPKEETEEAEAPVEETTEENKEDVQ